METPLRFEAKLIVYPKWLEGAYKTARRFFIGVVLVILISCLIQNKIAHITFFFIIAIFVWLILLIVMAWIGECKIEGKLKLDKQEVIINGKVIPLAIVDWIELTDHEYKGYISKWGDAESVADGHNYFTISISNKKEMYSFLLESQSHQSRLYRVMDEVRGSDYGSKVRQEKVKFPKMLRELVREFFETDPNPPSKKFYV